LFSIDLIAPFETTLKSKSPSKTIKDKIITPMVEKETPAFLRKFCKPYLKILNKVIIVFNQ
jgi:hypothetical protein